MKYSIVQIIKFSLVVFVVAACGKAPPSMLDRVLSSYTQTPSRGLQSSCVKARDSILKLPLFHVSGWLPSNIKGFGESMIEHHRLISEVRSVPAQDRKGNPIQQKAIDVQVVRTIYEDPFCSRPLITFTAQGVMQFAEDRILLDENQWLGRGDNAPILARYHQLKSSDLVVHDSVVCSYLQENLMWGRTAEKDEPWACLIGIRYELLNKYFASPRHAEMHSYVTAGNDEVKGVVYQFGLSEDATKPESGSLHLDVSNNFYLPLFSWYPVLKGEVRAYSIVGGDYPDLEMKSVPN